MAGISLILQNNPNVTQINCGTSSPRLSGTVDISAFPNLRDFRCISNGITALSGYAQNSNLQVVYVFSNNLSGQIPNLSGMTGLQQMLLHDNKFTGPFPNISSLTNLVNFFCFGNQLTGNIPELYNLPNFATLHCSSNLLTGPIPSLSGLTSLRDLYVNSNQLTGSIPSLSGLNNLRTVYCFGQLGATKLTSFAGGSVSNTLGDFQAHNNQLNQSSVNAILSAFVAAGRTTGTPVVSGTCILNLGGAGNFSPTGQGVTDVTTLRGRGWTVTTGTL